MAPERAVPWLDDMLDAIDWIGRLTAGRALADYRADRPMRDAVERNIERLSEASRHLPPELTGAHPELPWRQIAQVGNILRHAYRRVDHAMVWEIVELDLPALRTALERMRAGLEQDRS
ncbi:MAG: HepT-like ribonuclease domain-containing protein [Geminicoccaceae bacterium]